MSNIIVEVARTQCDSCLNIFKQDSPEYVHVSGMTVNETQYDVSETLIGDFCIKCLIEILLERSTNAGLNVVPDGYIVKESDVY